MTWAIWIKFLPLSHGGSTWNLASVGPVVLWKIFEHTHTHTHTFLHTRTQQLRVVPDEKKIWGGGWRQSTIFLWGERRWRGCCFCFVLLFLFNPVGNWLLWKYIIFWVDGPSQKCSLFKWDLLEWKKKKFLKNELYECHSGGVDW